MEEPLKNFIYHLHCKTYITQERKHKAGISLATISQSTSEHILYCTGEYSYMWSFLNNKIPASLFFVVQSNLSNPTPHKVW